MVIGGVVLLALLIIVFVVRARSNDEGLYETGEGKVSNEIVADDFMEELSPTRSMRAATVWDSEADVMDTL